MLPIITIDGPASSGKGTVAKIIAKKLGFHYLDSGAIYRVVGLIALRNNLDKVNASDDIYVNKILSLLAKVNLEFTDDSVRLDGENVTDLIREEKIGMLASKLSSIAALREYLLGFQRDFAKSPGLVTDGRDMGSVVFPDATLKIFLTASAEIRAARRFQQLQSSGQSATITAILDDIKARDRRDSERSVAPLTFDESFKVLDNSDITIDDTVLQIIKWMKEVFKNSGAGI